MNWNLDCSYNASAKRSFHSNVRIRLKKLAEELNFQKGDYEIRSNQGGIAVSGEVTLHHNNVYVQVSQPCYLPIPLKGILFRTCQGQKDYTGGHNFFTNLNMLDDIPGLAGIIKKIL